MLLVRRISDAQHRHIACVDWSTILRLAVRRAATPVVRRVAAKLDGVAAKLDATRHRTTRFAEVVREASRQAVAQRRRGGAPLVLAKRVRSLAPLRARPRAPWAPGLFRGAFPRASASRLLAAASRDRASVLLARVAGRGALPAGRWRQRLGARAAAAVARRREKREARATGLAAVWERYGWTAVGTHFGVYFATLAGLTSAVDQGLLGADADERREAVDKVAGALERVAPARAVDFVKESPAAGAFAVAWVAAKFTEPVRLVVTLFLVPRVAAVRGAVAAAAAAAAGAVA